VIALPPSLAGGVKVTIACALPAVAVPIVGASATVAGATGVTPFDRDGRSPGTDAIGGRHGKCIRGAVAEPADIDGGAKAQYNWP
jgi:hypothetical protein